MTTPRWDEIDRIEYMDQLLAYCICTLDMANRDPDNFWWRNPAARPDAQNSVNWEIVKDDFGNRFLVYTVILDYYNQNPLLTKPSLTKSILTGSPYQIKPNLVSIPTTGIGMKRPPIPRELDTLEKLIYWCAKCLEVAFIYTQFIQVCNQNNWIPEFIPVPDFGLNPNIVIPTETITILDPAPGAPTYLTSGEALFGGIGGDNQSSIPEWLNNTLENIGNNYNANNNSQSNTPVQQVDIGNAQQPGDPVYVNPNSDVCKEQDPSVVAFNQKGYQMLLEKIDNN